MKVIDLLNKIAKGELEDKTKVKFGSEIYEFWEKDKKIHGYSSITGEFAEHITRVLDWNKLDDEVEIIEEKEIEKLELCMNYEYEEVNDELEEDMKKIVFKINELIDAVNELRGKDEI